MWEVGESSQCQISVSYRAVLIGMMKLPLVLLVVTFGVLLLSETVNSRRGRKSSSKKGGVCKYQWDECPGWYESYATK